MTFVIGTAVTLLFGSTTFEGSLAFADATNPAQTPSATPSDTPTGSLQEFDSVCKSTVDNQATGATSPTGNQKLQYCLAAKTAKDASEAQSVMWKIWAGVSGICASACIASFAGVSTNQFVCIGVNTAAGITDAVVTKNYMNALMAIGTGGLAYSMNGNSGTTAAVADSTKGTTAAAPKKDIGACIIAASAAFQTYTSHSSMKMSQATAENSIAAAKAADSATTNVAQLTVTSANTTALSYGTSYANVTASNTTAAVTNSNGTTASNTSAANICSAARTSLTTGLMTQCALASNSNIPSFVGNPRFATDFKKASGMDFGDFAQKSSSPGQALASAMGGSLNANQATRLSAALKTFEQQLPTEVTSSAYSGGGGGGGSAGGGGDDPNMAAMMQGLMDQFMPKNPDDPSNDYAGLKIVIFANQTRSPTAITEDKSLGIFDRITYRYHFVGKRMLEGGI